MEKHYWKKNEILYLKELAEKYNNDLDKIVKGFNEKYSYDLSSDNIKNALFSYHKIKL